MGILDLFRLDGQAAVVTGAGKGIGRGIALALAEAGADVLVASRNQADIDGVADEIRRLGRRSATCMADLAEAGAAETLAAEAVKVFGKLTIWVNSVGGLPGSRPASLRDTTKESWDAQIATNLSATWMGSIAASGCMEADGGVIVNISSGAYLGPRPGNGAYAAAKAAVNSMTQSLAAELMPKIRVNAVAPGATLTPAYLETLNNRIPTEARRDEYLALNKPPMGRFGTPEDVGAAVVYLASEAASHITGICINVSGGKVMGY